VSQQLSASPVAEGDLVGGKYRVTRTLGVGGMGVVVAALQVDLNRRVALKFLLPEAAGHPEIVKRFAREARAAAQIHSEHVARIIDVGALPTGAPYLVMEYLDGHDLQQGLARHGPLAVDVAVGHILQASEALAEAHAAGIVHRDLKPANLFLARTPNGSTLIKVLDFGISKLALPNDTSDLTKAATVMGSPSYMAPEQIKAAKSVDPRADQWSLGVILYELLTGAKPFVADSMAELIWVILDNPFTPILSRRADLPPGLAAAIERCLAKNPDDRFANVAELVEELAPYGPEWSATSTKRTSHVLGLDMAHRVTQAPDMSLGHVLSAASLAAMGPVSGPTLHLEPDPTVLPVSMDNEALRPSPPSAPQRSAVLPELAAPAPARPATRSVTSSPVTERSTAPLAPIPAATTPPWSQSVPSFPSLPSSTAAKARSPFVIPIALGIVAALGLSGLLLSQGPSPSAPSSAPRPSAAPSAVAATSAPAVTASPVAPPSLPPAPPLAASAPPDPEPIASAVHASSPSHGTRPPRTTATGASNAVGAKSASPAQLPPVASSGPQKCSTVTTFDADGMKHFKQVCVP
jgi:serine/threonine protein kinase